MELTSEHIIQEIRYSEQRTKRMARMMDHLIKGYQTPFFDSSDEGVFEEDYEYNPENHAYEFVTWMVSQCVEECPQVRITSKRSSPDDPSHDVAKWIQHAVNRWIKDYDLLDRLQTAATTGLFAPAPVIVHTEENQLDPGIASPDSKWPAVTNFSPRNKIDDALAVTKEQARFVGHKWVTIKDDLIKLAEANPDDWYLKAVKELGEGVDVDETRPSHIKDGAPDRKEVTCIDITYFDYELEDDNPWGVPASPGREKGYWGTIFTLAISGSDGGSGEKEGDDEMDMGHMIRPPRPNFGLRRGAYKQWDIHKIPDSPFSLPPLVAMEGLVRDLNRHARANSSAAADFKNLIFVGDTDGDLPEIIRDKENHGVIPVDGNPRDLVATLPFGGMSQESFAHEQYISEKLSRTSGFGENQKGVAEGNVTATASAIANVGSSIRARAVIKSFERFALSILEAVTRIVAVNEDIRITLTGEDAQELGFELEPGMALVYRGGDLAADPAAVEDLEIELVPMVMNRSVEGEYKQQVMEVTEMFLQVAQAAPMAPFLDWKGLMKAKGQSIQWPHLEEMLNEELLFAMIGAQVAREGEVHPEVNVSSTGTGVRALAPKPQNGQLTPGLGGGGPTPTSGNPPNGLGGGVQGNSSGQRALTGASS